MLCAYDSRQSLFVFFIVQRFVASFSTILQSDADRETVAIYSLLSVTRTICNLRFTMRICNDCHDKALLSSSFIGISLFVHLICVQSVIPFRSEASQRRNMNAEFSDKHVRLSQSYMLCVNMLQTIDISIFRYLSHSLSMQTLQMHGFIHTHTHTRVKCQWNICYYCYFRTIQNCNLLLFCSCNPFLLAIYTCDGFLSANWLAAVFKLNSSLSLSLSLYWVCLKNLNKGDADFDVYIVGCFQIIFVTLFAVCSCAKLDNTYLPPPDAQNSGGNFGLAPPNQSNNGNNNGFNNGNNGNNNGNNFGGAPQNGFGQNPPQQQGFQPQESQQPPIAIISYENEPNYGDGSYKYSYETGTFTLNI